MASLKSMEFPEISEKNKQFFMRIAAWLVDNTSLTFEQIAQCCSLPLEEVQDIADEEIYIEKYNPIASEVIMEKDITDCQRDPNRVPKLIIKNLKRRKNKMINGFILHPRRRDKPDAIYHLIKKFPMLDNNVIAKLVSTTSCTVERIRNGSYYNMQNVKPQDPVLLGLCSQKNLEAEVENAEVEREKQERLNKIFKMIHFFCILT
ncbi:hypothetical protein BIY23_04030 [Wolbachia pipientis]|uniref:DUF1013 domain-containing protein n=1 Tax=Wolbachia pipientis TaxID=955 RepID=A0A1E7QJQ6_WOLPI|nr:cell cycle transcriptional regulator TrcR [Wolbachia pipientis]OEY86454.1 hypothetical protein BIY23_04030 [Wolbachia pipientis]